jgi:hypothetical protein
MLSVAIRIGHESVGLRAPRFELADGRQDARQRLLIHGLPADRGQLPFQIEAGLHETSRLNGWNSTNMSRSLLLGQGEAHGARAGMTTWMVVAQRSSSAATPRIGRSATACRSNDTKM